MTREKYFRLVYHCQFKDNEPCRTESYFLRKTLLHPKLNLWNGKIREWKYWESPEDEVINLSTVPEDLPILKVGWYGVSENEGVFNYTESYAQYNQYNNLYTRYSCTH
jgi:hypothetical protein